MPKHLGRLARRLFTLSVLTATLIAVISAGTPTKAECPYWNTCVSMYQSCMAWCNGSAYCESYCKQDYTDCICSNCGSCPKGGLP